MLLQELTGVKKFHKVSTEAIFRLLEKHGIKMIGAGKYGQVFTSDKWDYVVKTFRDDPSYLRFINYAMKHPNDHFPVIKKRPLQMHLFHKRYEGDDKVWLVKIEKLKPVNSHLGYFLGETIGPIGFYIAGKDQERMEEVHEKLPRPNGGYYYEMSYEDVLDGLPWYRSLIDAWIEIAKNVAEEKDWMDINEDNFMERDDGTIVLIDPLWEGKAASDLKRALAQFNIDIGVKAKLTTGPSYEKKIADELASELEF